MANTSSMATRSKTNARLLLPVFLRPRAIVRFLKDGRASLSSKIFFVLAIAYVVLPIDLVPDIAPIIGWLDDVGAATAALGWAAHRISAHAAREEEADATVIDAEASKP